MTTPKPLVVIETGARVCLHFSVALADGAIIDSNFEKQPASFRLGDGSLLPGFEAVLTGLSAGAEIERLLPAEQAFGTPNPANRQRFPIAKYRHLLEHDARALEPGSVLSFKDAAGFSLPGVVQSTDRDSVCVDFNHPLAGRDILFRARILSVLAPDVEAVNLKP